MNPTVTPTTYNGRTSGSNSASTSVQTVKKVASVSAQSSRNAHLKGRSVSPDRALLPLSGNRHYDRSRSRSRPENHFESQTLSPNLNINRWSHSTSSSVSAIDTEALRARANTSSRRMSIGPPLITSERGPISSRFSMTSRSSSQSPPRKQNSGSGFLQVDHHSSSRDISPVAISPLTPTSMFNPGAGEYVGETWQGRRTGKNGESVAMSVHYMRTGSQPSLKPAENIASQYTTQTPRPGTRERRPATAGQDGSAEGNTVSIRGRSHRSPSQKAMLSKALAKANTAVLLDNAQNTEGAIEAYAEACDILQQVLVRSSDMDDRKKLSAIRSTYSNRIAELHDLNDSFSGLMEKALPEDPPLDETNNTFFTGESVEPDTTGLLESVQIPPRQESLLPEIFGGETYMNESSRKRLHIHSLAVPMDTQYMPPPLSPRRPASPSSERDTNTPLATTPGESADGVLHAREDSTESTSWLDTLEDGDSSSRSSRLSSIDLGIRTNQHLADDIEAEFDAALNAAVDAAYDDSLTEEPTPRPDKHGQDFNGNFGLPLPELQSTSQGRPELSDLDLTREYDEGDSSEEEERLLEEMTKGYVFDDFSFDNKSKSALPRQSDSSTVSGRTWASSIPSTTATNATALSTLAESHEPSSESSPPPIPPAKDPFMASPLKAAPLPPAPTLPLPNQPTSSPTRTDKYAGLGIRERRISGQVGKQLKIETFAKRSSSKPTVLAPSVPELEISSTDRSGAPQTAPLEATSSLTSGTQPITPMTSMPSTESMKSESPATPALTQAGSQGSVDDSMAMPPSPAKVAKMMPPQAAVRKNLSSSSLRMRNLSVTTTETNNESPVTPINTSFSADAKKVVPPLPSAALPTPSTTAFGPQLLQAGGMYLFEDHTGATSSPETPRTPNAPTMAPPQPLEPCPESFLLRPFWLMRCLYQTLAHPRGGYITTRLFIPRDIWRVRNVKLRALDDKVSQCDLLTAALLKLAKVDTLDADAVLEELQSFEAVLDQVRTTLQKKIGSDVGFSGSSSIFKAAGEEDPSSNRTSNTTAKSLASSWRKLRSKSSAPAIGNQSGQKDGSTAGVTMSSLPMTSSNSIHSSRSHQNRKIAPPPTPSQLTNVQPIHAAYMSSLARLFDAVQVLDGIARQVEDPGLKCSNKTQVGLELGVKNAAEFFAFFIIRFVMADLMLLVDKFLKRGTEWVLT
ncbi:uncharacterized protein Z518_04755 [Rhinocladiella mackenziei CBS 650.93]|uniref:MIT domain-containing protein n=1 Tax=Rhinocladiella mackenziei CBS 650.93 TaxID=1442369 RepID=A0A0D2ILY6_9EURO|nr:uncharacterized protein Z518_04755 [Rhinocladiella mackenziei CBS 650.93]KIX06779.1 hypothetical protein Z518_04755 [Rhinocladiella mackenziei CBS 650.93]